MKEHSVLLDLSTIMSGQSFAGIPQDTRLLFRTFAEITGIKPIGLICSLTPEEVTHLKFNKDNNPILQALAYTDYFFKLENASVQTPAFTLSQKLVRKLTRTYRLLQCGIKLFKKNYSFYKSSNQYDDYIWRKAFHGFIDSSFKELIIKQDFVLSDFNKSIFTQRILRGFPLAHMDTPGIDFAIFQSGLSQCPHVSKGTIPIIRFHDSVVLKYPDTIADNRMSIIFAKSLLASYKHAYFVCNSQPVCDELLTLAPSLEKRAFVVPLSLSFEHTKVERNDNAVPAIISARKSEKVKINPHVFNEIMTNSFEYIISVSTLEPRKNFLSLIRAWERVRYQRDEKLKLIIVGSPGWKYEPILASMRQHVSSGNIIYLEKVPVNELATLYAHARAFIFPTYYEGFGITPIEAMHVGCPVVVSDTPTTRWVLGDAAMYCDPYDVSSIAASIEKLLYSPESEALSQDMIRKGRKIIEKYTTRVVGTQWLNLFDQLKSRKI